MVKIIFMVLTIIGIGGLSAVGTGAAEIGVLSTIGIGLGTAVSAVIATFKKR